jgi:hypothetical protein
METEITRDRYFHARNSASRSRARREGRTRGATHHSFTPSSGKLPLPANFSINFR